jgi:3-oxoacyl-[acyl-carrier protein] reductase
MNLKEKVVIITGAARGLGRAIAEDLAGAGASLALIDMQAAACAETAAACTARGVRVRTYGADVANEGAVAATFDQIVADFGRLDGIVNNAGILRDAMLVKARNGEVTGKMTLAQWQAVIDVNLTGVFLCGREAAERMIRLGNGGVIVNISSISRAGNAGQSNYSAAKAGVAALAVVWARELARYGIRTGAIAPGFVSTPMVATMKAEMLEMMLKPVPLQRLGQPEEIAQAVRFVFENEFFTGRVLEVDGGLRL